MKRLLGNALGVLAGLCALVVVVNWISWLGLHWGVLGIVLGVLFLPVSPLAGLIIGIVDGWWLTLVYEVLFIALMAAGGVLTSSAEPKGATA